MATVPIEQEKPVYTLLSPLGLLVKMPQPRIRQFIVSVSILADSELRSARKVIIEVFLLKDLPWHDNHGVNCKASRTNTLHNCDRFKLQRISNIHLKWDIKSASYVNVKK